ncbi:hypothetical protein C0J52_26221 [Blattella germanica]|nr:hypothetical protein C0J52_26221 [Blattella germanica]
MLHMAYSSLKAGQKTGRQGLDFQGDPLQSVTRQRNDTFLLEACPHNQSASLLKPTPLSPASNIPEDMEPQRVARRPGSANMGGELFEVGMATLLFLRGYFQTSYFSLNVNVKGAGAFDDVVFDYAQTSGARCKAYMQLKHKTSPKPKDITKEALCAQSGDFSLIRYFDSFCHIQQGNSDTNTTNQFVIYTNAGLPELPGGKILEDDNLKRYGGLLKTLEGNKEKKKNVHDLQQKQDVDELNELWQCFISKLRLFVRQVSVNDLDNLIKETLKNYLGTDKLFFSSNIVFIQKVELSAKAVQIVTDGCTELSCLQVQQSLKDIGHFIVDFNTLVSRTDEVLLKWRFLNWCKVLVLEGSLDHSVMSIEKINNIMSKVCDLLQSTEKRIISISNKGENSFIANFRKHFNVEVHHGNFNLSILDEKSIVRILDCEVEFQGIIVKLGTLADNPSTREAVKANLLLALLSKEGPIKIGECLPKPGPHYVARTLYRKECVRNNIFQDNVFPKLAVSGLSKEQLRLIGVGDKIEQFNENTKSVEHSPRYFIIKCAEDFNSLCKKYNEDIHWIHWSEGRFVWWLSNGSLKPIAEHFEDIEAKYDKIESFVNLPHKVVLILGEPGMGKSEEIKSLASQLKCLDKSTWVVTVVLNDCTEYLSKDQIDVRELLLKAANISKFGTELFDYQLETGGNIIVLFDGLDEINPKYTEKVNSMIEQLMTTKVRKIWLTSRPVMWGVLEKQFRVLPFRLLPLTKNEQMNLLPKLWTYTESCGKDRIEFEKNAKIFAEKLIKMTDTTLKDSSNLLGIPLHLMLLAEVLKNEVAECSINSERDLPRNLDLLNLYSKFVDSKRNLYYAKIKLDRDNAGTDNLCEQLKRLIEDNVMNSAMVTLFDEDINHLSNKEEILRMNKNFLADIDSGNEMVGLVTHVQNGKAVFVHRTFAEYFAAIWFSKNYLSNLVYFRKFYLSGSFETVRMFFDRILARENKLHTCVLSCSIDEITTLLSDNNAVIDELDRSGRTALHLAVANFLNLLFNRKNTTINNIVYDFDTDELPILVRQGSNKNVTDLLHIVEVLLKKNADCSITDNILYWTPLQFAENNRIWCLLDLLLEYYSLSPGDLSVIQDKILDQNFVTNVLEVAAVDECVNVIQLIFDYGACDSTFVCFPYVRTLLHVAAFLGHLKLTQFLIERGADLEARDMFGITPLMASSLNHNHMVTKMLLEQGADPNTTCKKGRSAIHFAFHLDNQTNAQFRPHIGNEYKTQDLVLESSITEAILILLKHGANPNAKNDYGNTPMHYAAGKNLMRVVECLLELKCDIDCTNTEDETPLLKAIKWGNEEIAIKLLTHGANRNANNYYGNTPMHYAAEENLMKVVECLLELKCDFDCTNTECETPFLKAIKRGIEEIAIKLLKHGANFNAKNDYGNTPMHYAAGKNLMRVVECLLELKCDFDCTNKNGETPLLEAVERGNEEIAIKLLKHGANPNAKNDYGNTPMHYAVERNLKNVVECLLELKCDINCTSKNGETPLLEAVERGNEEIAIKLLKHGDNPNAKGQDDNSVMHYAAERNLMKVLECLLELKCDIDCANKNGETPLLEAVERGNEEITIKLLKYGANPNANNDYGDTPMHYAAEKNLMKVVDCLLELKCDIDRTNKNGKTPLLGAVARGNEEIAIKLLKHGANPNAKDEDDNPVMHYATERNLKKVVECLLELKCDIDCTNKNGETRLLEAVERGNEEIAIKLLKHGANPNAKNDYGNTPMHYAAQRNLKKVVECLLERKCDIDCTNKNGETPQLQAVERRNEEIAIKLLKHGANPNAKDEDDNSQGANPNAKDEDDNSVMHYATERNLKKVVECLLELKCDIDCTNKNGETRLLEAVERGYEEIAIKLLKHGANPNAKNDYGNTPMHYAAERNLKKVHGANPNAKDEDDNSVMHYAAEENLVKVVECLLELKCDIDCANKNGETPLLQAVERGNEEITIKLLKHGANPNAKNDYGNTAMHYAVGKNLMRVVECLLELKCDFECTTKNGETPLLQAVERGNVEIAIKLLKHGANPNAKNDYGNTTMHYAAERNLKKLHGANPNANNDYGNTPMHYAAEENLMKVVDCLLELKCDIDCSNKNGETPLLEAVELGNQEIAIKLLKHGANPNAKDQDDTSVMHYAAEENLMKAVECLLELKCDIDCTNKNGETPLLAAVERGNEEIAIKLLKHGANPNAKNDYSNTPMHYAAQRNLKKVVGCLLELKCDIDRTNKNGKTPLLQAVERGNEEISIKLLKHGANPNAKNNYGNTPMHYAAERNLKKLVECLLELKCDIDCTNKNGETPLLEAVVRGNEEITIKLLKHGANPNANNDYGNTPMHYAAERNLKKVVECLLELKCDIYRTNKNGKTPLLQAVERGNEEIAIKLLKHGANPNANNDFGNTPMHYATERNLKKVVECLLELKCDFDCTNTEGETPLLKAIKRGNEQIAIKLLKHRANPNANNDYGNTPIHYAAEENLMKVVECLLELKCDFDCTNIGGETPLLQAVERGNEEIAIMLLKHGANPNAKNDYGNTPMHYAAERNLKKVVECLLELKCDFDCTNKNGKTPLLQAVERGNEEIAIKFLKHGANPNANNDYGNTPMHYAAEKNLKKVVECLLELKCDFDGTNTEGETPLLKAIKRGNEEIAIKLLKHGANSNANNDYGNTPMHYAAEENLKNVVECLLELKCDIDCTNKNGETPLLEAVERGNEEIAIKLLKHGANPNAKNDYGNTPMHYAAERTLKKVVQCLLELKCDFDCTNTEGETPLLKAIKRGNEEIAIKLLKQGANPNANIYYGNTPMHYAAEENLIKVLGSNPNAKDECGNTPMHYAAGKNLMKVVECLLELKCDIDCTNKKGVTPLLEAFERGNKEIVIKLLEHGSTPKAKDKYGETPME